MKIFWTWAIVLFFFLWTYTMLFGQEARYQRRSRGNKRRSQVLCSFLLLLLVFCFLLWLLAIISSSEKSHLCQHSGCKLVKVPQRAALVVSPWPRTALSVSPLSTWIYVFIYIKRLGRTSRADRFNSIGAEEEELFLFFCDLKEKEKKLLCLRTGSRCSLCSLSMDRVFDLWLPLDPLFGSL